MAKKVAYILGCFPDGTETFVFNEINGLDQIGLDITLFSIHKPANNRNHLDYKAWLPKTIYAYPSFSWKIILSHLYFMFRQPFVYFALLCQYRKFGGKRAFWEGVYFSRIIQKMRIRHVHAHFAWSATDCARIIKRLTGIPFSFTAHAADIYAVPDKLEEKLEEAKFVLTCVKNNKTYINRIFGQHLGRKVEVVYHGVDLERFKPLKTEDKTVDVLSIGNLVKKKGHRYLIEACGILKRKGIFLKCLIIGEGPEKAQLSGIIKELGLEKYVEIANKCLQVELPSVYAKSKAFVFPTIITDSGDRDGIANVLVEAMAMELPVISTKLPNIAELVENEKDGILIPEGNAQLLAETIDNLLSDDNKRKTLGKNAHLKIKNEFDFNEKIKNLKTIFKELTK